MSAPESASSAIASPCSASRLDQVPGLAVGRGEGLGASQSIGGRSSRVDFVQREARMAKTIPDAIQSAPAIRSQPRSISQRAPKPT